MSRDPEEVNRITENTYKNVMEQFNPGLRNLVVLGKVYEKSVTAMIQAGRAYYDSVAKIGEMTRVSPVSKELGHVLIDISDAHRKLNDYLEDSFRKFHKEIISELEKKTEQDVKYMNATLKKYQTEHRSKVDSLERSQADLKKLKRKSQGGRNATKYDHKEAEYLQTISSRQSDIQRFIAEGCKEALLEEKRRFCFLADKHCNFAVHLNHYHVQAAELLNDKLSQWQDTCSDVTKVPDTVVGMMHEMKTPSTTPISGTPQPSPMMERNKLVDGDYDSISKSIPRMPPAPPNKAHTSPLVDMFNNPPTIQKNHPHERLKTADNPEEAGLPRSMSVSTGLNMMKRSKVKTIFPHNPGNNKTLLSFAEGDIITLLISEDKDGWLYGEHEITKSRGWFPSSYTRILTEPTQEPVHVPSPSTVRSISTVNLTDKSNVVLPPPDYLDQPSSKASTDSPRASINSTVGKATPPPLPSSTPQKPNANGTMKPPFLSGENPFATVKLRPTVTNDRSAPIIR
ncbi:BAR/IMD domain-containing adapter protein 2-like 1 [Pleurodeles waltl]|uniref:BAR/IMD domain-containing adapter protein 2-like 1 n=1 Tax=Pleurodeles waltl TaxID=8319 RepID=UPI0037093CCC